jgi:hypothetical protein
MSAGGSAAIVSALFEDIAVLSSTLPRRPMQRYCSIVVVTMIALISA